MATFNGTPGNDIFTGGGDSDTAAGNGGDDNLSGGGSDDFLSGGAGADTIDGGDGNDWLYGAEQSPAFNIFTTPPTYPILDTGADRDTLIGGAGSDAIFAGYGDTVDGGADSDSLLISFLGAPSGITFDMHLATQTIGGATITSIENLVWVEGSNFNDYIDAGNGGYGDAVLYGMGGDDTLIASYYSAILDGGDGNDIVDGRNSGYLRSIYGGAGDDTVYSSLNSTAITYGGDGNDTIYAGGEVHGGTGNDQIVMQYSYYGARVYGEEGDDVITAASSSNIMGGGSGADTLNGNSGNDSLGSANFVPGTYSGAQFDDDMGLEHDVLAGFDGNDLLAIGYGDSADGGTGSDALRLSLGGLSAGVTFSTAGVVSGQPYTLGGGTIQNIETLAYLRGTDFNDTLTLVTQSTLMTVNAGAGDDLIFSQNSSVALNGGDGNDRFVSGPAGDSFDGGNGIDTIDYQLATAAVTVNLSANSAFGNGAGGDQLVNVENVFGSTFGDTLTGNELANELRGQAGDDVLNGAAGADTLDGGAGADTMSGGTGDDLYLVDVAGDQVTEATDEGHDLVLSGISYSLTANVEDLTLAGETAIDGTGNGLGNALMGNAAANALNGLGGNDVLTGAAGADTLTGGSGNDLFRDSAAGLNGDTITDFSVGDRIIIADANVSGFQFSLSGHTVTYSGGSLTLDTVPTGTIIAHAAAGGGVELSIATLVAPAGHAGDFNGDHRDDVIWRNDNGALTDWLGTTAGGFAPNGSNLLEVVDSGWQIAGIGDFNGDTRDDVLWRRADGAMTDWLGTPSGGLSPNGANLLEAVSPDWQIAAVGDINGDTRDDILWRRGDGALTDWLGTANGSFTPNAANLLNVVSTDWHVIGLGDFNGDNRADLLWRNDDGRITDWLATATGGFSDNLANAYNSISLDWQIVGIGDFNGDHRDDILLRNADGRITDWLGNANGGFTPNSGNFYTSLGTDWSVASIGDFNGDTRDDILFRNSDGRMTDWLGTATGSFTDNLPNAYQAVDTHWHVQPHMALV